MGKDGEGQVRGQGHKKGKGMWMEIPCFLTAPPLATHAHGKLGLIAHVTALEAVLYPR